MSPFPIRGRTRSNPPPVTSEQLGNGHKRMSGDRRGHTTTPNQAQLEAAGWGKAHVRALSHGEGSVSPAPAAQAWLSEPNTISGWSFAPGAWLPLAASRQVNTAAGFRHDIRHRYLITAGWFLRRAAACAVNQGLTNTKTLGFGVLNTQLWCFTTSSAQKQPWKMGARAHHAPSPSAQPQPKSFSPPRAPSRAKAPR